MASDRPPDGWTTVPLGEVCTLRAGDNTLTKGSYVTQGYPAFSASGPDGFLEGYHHEGEAVVVSAVGARCGKCFWAEGKWTAIANTLVLRCKSGAPVDLRFLFFLVNRESFWPRSGSAQPFVPRGAAVLTPVLLPPLPEQQAIAHILRTVQQAGEQTEQVIAATKQLKRSLIEAEMVRTESLPASRLADLLAEKPQYGYTTTAVPGGIGPLYLRITDIQDGGVAWPTVPSCLDPPEHVERFTLKAGDLVVARIGATTGKTFLVMDLPGEVAVFASYLIRLRTDPDRLLPGYLGAFSESSRYWIQINAQKGGRLKTGVNAGVLAELEVHLPPLEEQGQLVTGVDALSRKIAAEEQRRDALAALFDSLLGDLMSARLRVDHLVEGVTS
jgi:type I restriction enzyme S subunit